MSRILFIDTACAAFPNRDDDFGRHCVRVAVIGETDGEVEWSERRLVLPSPEWKFSPLTLPYHRASPTDFAKAGMPLKDIAALMSGALDEADLIVAHNADFHRRTLDALFTDAEVAYKGGIPWYCTMEQAKPICGLKTAKGALKSPKLSEAYRFFFDEDLADPKDWQQFANAQVAAVRDIYHEIEASKGGENV